MDELYIRFPGGYFRIMSKEVGGAYPGVFVEVMKDSYDGETLPKLAACVEYLLDSDEIHIETYSEEFDEPNHIMCFEDGRELQ